MASRAHGRLRGRRAGGAGLRRGGRGAVAGSAGPAGRAGWAEAPPPQSRGGPAGPIARWVDEVVIGWGLCPFAEPARDRTRFVELAPPNSQTCANTAEVAASVRAGIAEELRLLAREPPGRPATTVVALRPEPAFTFEDFMLLVVLPLQALAEKGRNEFGETLFGTGGEGSGCGIQCVPFHPEASYGEGAEADWATRAPVPAVHLLRDCDVEAAELQWEAAGLDPADIHRDNVKRLRATGTSRAAAVVQACLVKPEPCPAGEGAISAAADATRTEAAAQALLVEAASAGADTGSIALRRVGPSGWGAVAAHNLQWNDLLLSLPRGALRTPSDAEAAGVGNTGHPAGDLASLVLFERSLGQESALCAYVNMLPSLETFRAHHPLMATEEELVACLGRNTLVGAEAVARRQEALGLVGAVREACGFGPSALEDDAMWALTVVSSRAFHLDLPEGSSLCLCPVADMLNHSEAASAQRRARLQWDSDRNVAIVRAFRDFDAGEEVFDSFGATLSVSDAFLRYGFAAGVGIERIIVPLARLGPCRSQAGQSILAAASLEDAELVFTAEGPDEVGLGCLAASEATEEELRAAGWGTGEAEGVLARICAGIEQPWACKLAARTQTRLAGELQGLLEQHNQRSEWNSSNRSPWQVEARIALESERCILQAAAASAVAQADALS